MRAGYTYEERCALHDAKGLPYPYPPQTSVWMSTLTFADGFRCTLIFSAQPDSWVELRDRLRHHGSPLATVSVLKRDAYGGSGENRCVAARGNGTTPLLVLFEHLQLWVDGWRPKGVAA